MCMCAPRQLNLIMKSSLPLANKKKLTLVFRVEPGSLGPDGGDHVDAFCEFAQRQLASLDADFMQWVIVPRRDKSLAEMEYQVDTKKLNHHQAEKYLQIFDKSLDDFEGDLAAELSRLIGQFLGH